MPICFNRFNNGHVFDPDFRRCCGVIGLHVGEGRADDPVDVVPCHTLTRPAPRPHGPPPDLRYDDATIELRHAYARDLCDALGAEIAAGNGRLAGVKARAGVCMSAVCKVNGCQDAQCKSQPCVAIRVGHPAVEVVGSRHPQVFP